jgi:hypothetical protein
LQQGHWRSPRSREVQAAAAESKIVFWQWTCSLVESRHATTHY